MSLWEALRIASTSLSGHQSRTLAAILSIAIGIAMVSSFGSYGQSFQRYTASQLARIETDLLILKAQPDDDSPENARLTDGDLEAIRKLPNVRSISARYTDYAYDGELQSVGVVAEWGTIIGTDPGYLRPTMRVILGRFFSNDDLEERARAALLNWPLAQKLFPDGRPLGRTILVKGVSFQVVGILAPQPSDPYDGGIVILPISVARDRLFPDAALGSIQVSEAYITLEQPDQIEATRAAISSLLRDRHQLRADQGNDFSFQNPGDNVVGAMNNVESANAIFLSIISSFILVVAGIDIFNIMLASVAERTREIGLRKAVGASRHDILAQFLIESLLIGLVGGVVGLLLALLLINLGAVVIQFQWAELGIAPYMLLDLPGVILNLCLASMVGLIAGINPAIQASRLTPIEALQTN